MSVNALDSDGKEVTRFTFLTLAAHESWLDTVQSLKQEIAGINELDPKLHRTRYSLWVFKVHKFGREVGDSKIPNDIKKSVHSVQDQEGWRRTFWGVIRDKLDQCYIMLVMFNLWRQPC